MLYLVSSSFFLVFHEVLINATIVGVFLFSFRANLDIQEHAMLQDVFIVFFAARQLLIVDTNFTSKIPHASFFKVFLFEMRFWLGFVAKAGKKYSNANYADL